MNMAQINAIRNGDIEPIMCGSCDYCKAHKELKGYISVTDLIND